MKNLTKVFAIAIMMFGFATSSFAQAERSAAATASATIVQPISILQTDDMNFGNVAVQSTAGTVILSPSAVRSTTGGVTIPTVGSGAEQAAAFTVTGEGAYTYVITLPTADYTISDGAENNMTVNAFTCNGVDTEGVWTGTLASGTFALTVGATLNVDASQLAGVYTNETGFEVTVNYN
ncbi:DUF4402 domain-containing protein [Labilibaculum antarcticum]|uniref:DUF4402 domain-containing protein n=1 Tax=Labilibaculum antarcticum TaxID=1717717 RepID=A0A1Y1CJ11_9BACT|nr:DUF4402 domain-containing protein [Labilibaculum antarcticum]BAX80063.1 hypothetical protein ALGA_1688 [Labilibaculum antarcticum]